MSTPITTTTILETGAPEVDLGIPMKKYMCLLCGLIYNEAEGWPDEGIAKGTRWADIPPNWRCPDCGACKEDFEMVEI